MKSLIGLLVLVFSFTVLAFPNAYNTKEIYEIKTDLDTKVGSMVESGNEGLSLQRQAVIEWDASSDPAVASASAALSVSIPASWIKNVAVAWETVPVSASSNTMAIQCESANDLLSAADMTGESLTAVTAGIPQSASMSTWLKTDGCTPAVAIGAGTSGITAGKGYIIIDYVEVP